MNFFGNISNEFEKNEENFNEYHLRCSLLLHDNTEYEYWRITSNEKKMIRIIFVFAKQIVSLLNSWKCFFLGGFLSLRIFKYEYYV